MGHLLLFLIFLPLAAAVVVLLLGSGRAALVRQVSLLSMLVSACILWEVAHDYKLRPTPAAASLWTGVVVEPQLEVRYTWISFRTSGDVAAGGLQFLFGVDGISLCLLTLTVVMGAVAVLGAWETIRDRVAEFHALLLLLQCGLLGSFCSFDLMLFYVFFELTLIPLLFIVGVWGGPKRQAAARKFFFYTLAGSLVMLVGLIGIGVTVHLKSGRPLTFAIPELASTMQEQMRDAEGLTPTVDVDEAEHFPASNSVDLKRFWYSTQTWLFLALFLGFAVKTPLIPFHTWLPSAYTEAPTIGTVMLAAVLSKLGCYGFLRICVPLLPYACWNIGIPLVGTLAVVGILYGALCALAQTDIKRMVAYSSVSHLGFIVLGIFALNAEGLAGGTIQMLNHGIITGGLFLLAGMVADRYRTRNIEELSGLGRRLPLLTFAMFFFCFASAGLPGLAGFVGEVLALLGMFERSPVFAGFGTLGVVLGAWYLLTLLQRVFFGPLREPEEQTSPPPADLRPMEIATLLPLGVLCLLLGLHPGTFLGRMNADVESLAAVYRQPEHLKPPVVRTARQSEAK